MALTGFLAGGIGFPLGQCVQAFHKWNPHLFGTGWLATLDPYINWWNLMEITFGMVLGSGLALGLWLNRRRIANRGPAGEAELDSSTEWWLLAVHAAAIAVWNFYSYRPLDAIADHALPMGMIPLIAVAGGRLWPYLLSLPVVALPIAGKTVREVCYRTDRLSLPAGWVLLFAIPMAAMIAAALLHSRAGRRGSGGRSFTRGSLLLCAWLYFGLNFAFFAFPWPWAAPTYRTPSAWIFLVCAVGLTIVALAYGRGRRVASPAEGS
jgi:hypothetical protein